MGYLSRMNRHSTVEINVNWTTKMHSFMVLLLCIIAIASSAVVTHNGQPGCKTEEEVNVGIFRNNWDPTSYWKCVELNEPAILQRCPDQTAFMESVKDCVSWDEWLWEEPETPMSVPDQN